MEDDSYDNVGGPLGKILEEMSKKCGITDCSGFFLSKKKIAFTATISLIGKIVYGDEKYIEKDKNSSIIIKKLTSGLSMNSKKAESIIDIIIQETKKRKFTTEEYARQIFEIFAGDKEILKNIILLLIIILIMEIGVLEEEDSGIRKISKIFQISEIEYSDIKNNCLKRGECESVTEISNLRRRDLAELCSCENFYSKNISDEFSIKK